MLTGLSAFVLLGAVALLLSDKEGAGIGGAYFKYSCHECNENGRQRPATVTEPLNYIPKCRHCKKPMKLSNE